MKNIPPALLADLQANCTTMAFLWTIEMANGTMIRGTDHDLDIVIPQSDDSPAEFDQSPPAKYAGTYFAIANVTAGDIVSSSDLTVDNLEVIGAFPQAPYTEITDVTVDEIEAGLLDMAPVTIMICNWQHPEHGYVIVKAGFLGAITRNSDGKYTTEVRGLSQLLSQAIIRLYSTTCNVVKFGDGRCRLNVQALAVTGVVGSNITDPQQFAVTLDLGSPPSTFPNAGGTITFTSGLNMNFGREVKIDPNTNEGILQVWEAFPNQVQEGDEFSLTPGCDRQMPTCQLVYNNLIHFRGYGVFIPGLLAITAGPTTATGLN